MSVTDVDAVSAYAVTENRMKERTQFPLNTIDAKSKMVMAGL